MDKKEFFKRAILEFQESALPKSVRRDLAVPTDTDKVVSIYGPRRAGKTFYLFQLAAELSEKTDKSAIIYVNLEDERLLPLEAKDMHLLTEAYYELFPENRNRIVYLFLDEIQTISGWEVFVRRIHDSRRFRIFLTGSSAKLLSREIATSLRGRTLAYRLPPLSFGEFLKFRGVEFDSKIVRYSEKRFEVVNALDRYLEWGGFPEISNVDEELSMDILQNYFEMIVYRDIADRFSLRNSHALKTLLKYLFFNVSNLFSINRYHGSTGPEARMSRETLGEYLSCILETDTVFLIPRFGYSMKAREKNPKKIYLIDNGLRKATAFTFSQDFGRLAENLVFQSLIRRGFEIFYWKGRQEVDFVATRRNERWAVNVSFGESIPEREMAGLSELAASDVGPTRQILIARNERRREGEIEIVPLWEFLLDLSAV